MGNKKVYKNMQKMLEDDLYLLAGLPIEIENTGSIRQLKLEDIAKIGVDRYDRSLSVLTFDIEDLGDLSELGVGADKVKCTYDMISWNCIASQDFLNDVVFALELFFCEKIEFFAHAKDGDVHTFFYVGDKAEKRYISRKNYEDIKKALTVLNCVEKPKDQYKPKNKKAQEIADKLRKSKEKLNEIKKKNGKLKDSPKLSDLVSYFCAEQKMLASVVYKMPFFEFNDQFKRLDIIGNYNISVQSILAGADPKQVDLKHPAQRYRED